VNNKIKNRESFRPFAPSILSDYCTEYFYLNTSSSYMEFVRNIRAKYRLEIDSFFNEMSLKDKLKASISKFPAITHIDYSARIQTVNKETNSKFYDLITSFKDLTECPMLLNTSFNVNGEPIVNTPEEAYQCFKKTEMDYLVIGNYVFSIGDW